MARLTFAVPGGLDLPTGGAIYDRRVVEGLRVSGWQVEVLNWPGSFPFPDEAALQAVAGDLATLPDGTLVVIDGLALGTLPDLAHRHAVRLRLVALVHHPLALETGLSAGTAARFAAEEAEALKAARRVIVTSATTGAILERDFGVSPGQISVVSPGLDLGPLPARSMNEHLRILSVGTVSPRKGHHLLVEALAGLADLDWSCRIVGSIASYPEAAAALAEQIDDAALSERVALVGALGARDLADEYTAADIFALASLYEGYGMVLAEAMGRGLPIVATTGGAIPEVVRDNGGLLVPPGDVGAMRAALRSLMENEKLRVSLGTGARAVAERIGGWDICAARFAEALRRVS